MEYVSIVTSIYSKVIKYGDNELLYIEFEKEKDQELEPSQGLEPEETTKNNVMHWSTSLLHKPSR